MIFFKEILEWASNFYPWFYIFYNLLINVWTHQILTMYQRFKKANIDLNDVEKKKKISSSPKDPLFKTNFGWINWNFSQNKSVLEPINTPSYQHFFSSFNYALW